MKKEIFYRALSIHAQGSYLKRYKTDGFILSLRMRNVLRLTRIFPPSNDIVQLEERSVTPPRVGSTLVGIPQTNKKSRWAARLSEVVGTSSRQGGTRLRSRDSIYETEHGTRIAIEKW